MAIYLRDQWGADSDKGGYDILGMVNEAYIHHFNSNITAPQEPLASMARMRGALSYHRDTQGWGDIGYSWCVDDQGNIFEGRGWWKTGAHTYGYNSRGYGICWLGDSNVSLPSAKAIFAIGQVIKMGIAEKALNPLPTIVAHRDRVPDTSCCGGPMYGQLPQIRQLVGTFGPASELHTPTPATALPRHNEDFEMHLVKYLDPTGTELYGVVRGDGTVKFFNRQVLPWEVINSKMVQFANAGLVPRHPDGTPVVGELFDDAMAELTEVAA